MRRRHDMHQPGVDTPPSCWQAARRKLVYTALALLLSMVCASPAWARAYGNYEVRQLLVPASRPGAGGSFNMAYFDAMLSDLSEHAANYPPTFDSPADAQRAKRDTRQLIGMLDTAFGTSPPTQLLLRMALLGSIGHNLALPEGASFAQANFSRILRADANDAQATGHAGRCVPDELWATVNRRAVEFLDSVTLQSLVDDQIAKGVEVDAAPARKRLFARPATPKPLKITAPNSVFALGRIALAKR